MGAGRDLATGVDGNAYLVDAAATSVVVDGSGGRSVLQVFAEPAVAGLEAMVGERAGSGFRRALAAAAPELERGGSLTHQLLDETPVVTLVAGSVPLRMGLSGHGSGATGKRKLPIGVCAGWSEGGALAVAAAETGRALVSWGPPAPALDDGDDDLAWHPVEPLPPQSVRRRRLVDVWRGVGPDGRTASAPIRVEVRFRDTYSEADASETVVHEYGLVVRVDPDTWTILEAEAVPGPLPAPECPAAAASASRLVGEPIEDLRSKVRDDFTGTTTCTHLNDTFRAIADVRHLWTAASMARAERPPS